LLLLSEALHFVKLSALFYFLGDVDITLTTSWVISVSPYWGGNYYAMVVL